MSCWRKRASCQQAEGHRRTRPRKRVPCHQAQGQRSSQIHHFLAAVSLALPVASQKYSCPFSRSLSCILGTLPTAETLCSLQRPCHVLADKPVSLSSLCFPCLVENLLSNAICCSNSARRSTSLTGGVDGGSMIWMAISKQDRTESDRGSITCQRFAKS